MKNEVAIYKIEKSEYPSPEEYFRRIRLIRKWKDFRFLAVQNGRIMFMTVSVIPC